MAEFYNTFGADQWELTFAYQPEFMAINVLDQESKEYLLVELKVLPENHYNKIAKSITKIPTQEQRINLQTFINKFAARRNLDLNIYPTNFINWINQ